MSWVYMVRCRDGSLYTGWTQNLPRRLAAHNNGTGAKYTRSRGPVALAWAEEAGDKKQAMAREAAVKKLAKPQKEAMAAEYARQPGPKQEQTL